MGLFNIFNNSTEPYKEASINLLYQLLFCDNIDLYKRNTPLPYTYPFDILFSGSSTIADFQKITDDHSSDPRVKVLAYNRQRACGLKPNKKELLAVIVEVALDQGLDVLASFNNGTARYFNYTGKILIWETTDEMSNELTRDLFSKSQNIVYQLGPWDKPRLPHPAKGNARITFLVSDGLYFGEGNMDVLFSDKLGGPALAAAAQLMKYITGKSLKENNH